MVLRVSNNNVVMKFQPWGDVKIAVLVAPRICCKDICDVLSLMPTFLCVIWTHDEQVLWAVATRLCRHMLKNNYAGFILVVQQTLCLEVGKNILLACCRLLLFQRGGYLPKKTLVCTCDGGWSWAIFITTSIR